VHFNGPILRHAAITHAPRNSNRQTLFTSQTISTIITRVPTIPYPNISLFLLGCREYVRSRIAQHCNSMRIANCEMGNRPNSFFPYRPA
jgi:hypothetical protein